MVRIMQNESPRIFERCQLLANMRKMSKTQKCNNLIVRSLRVSNSAALLNKDFVTFFHQEQAGCIERQTLEENRRNRTQCDRNLYTELHKFQVCSPSIIKP